MDLSALSTADPEDLKLHGSTAWCSKTFSKRARSFFRPSKIRLAGREELSFARCQPSMAGYLTQLLGE